MQFMQHSKCIKCIKSRLIVSKKAFSFYVLSTSFLRNGYMEVPRLYKLHIFLGLVDIDSVVCGNRYFISGKAHQKSNSTSRKQHEMASKRENRVYL